MLVTVIAVVAGVVAILAIGLRIAFVRIEKRLSGLKSLPVARVDVSKIADGDYPGAFGSFPVRAEVLVRVRGGRIDRVELVKHDNGQGKGAEALTARVVEKQDNALDAVSGATYSSKVILKAIESALLSAAKQHGPAR